MDFWIIALFGTNEYYEIAEDSTIDLSSLGTSNPLTDDNWLKLNIYGVSPHRELLNNEFEQRIGGIVVHNSAQIQTFNVKLAYFIFPNDMHKYEQLCDVLKKKFIYFYKGTYTFDNWSIHPDGKAIRVATKILTEDDYESGIKAVTLEMRKEKPML